ncbi:gamma-glutamyltranspeptidase/glutathione hydrolase [Rhodobium orientis]|uniref:Gamma-glutamyltransferase n=1 Tax=Rhodobium orientis TaxID=34017 RepID=A0A327JTL3_9HYPH|nr:gamma-glutamyltransferase [Rhodobium orientis]MBB4304316.1 gamma-glutamyltranspeptidase/glutathione hydrolase [Rhodobium orientis]MBK5948190.1 hypothetical protein [Rhodobium orientis]RAI28814.1 hypothetical protein CH339_05300 [Rhodobium orientis]
MTYRHGRYGAVAAGHGVTAAAAEEILAEGGNAFDAAIAALWTACVAEPVFASPGGGGFLMARPAAGALTLYDFFVDTPLKKRPEDDIEFAEILADFGTATQAFHIGAGAAATPGFVPGLFAVHAAHGRVPMKRLVEPAIRAAREGVTVTAFQAFLFKVVSPILIWTAPARAVFSPNDKLLEEGAPYRNPDLADVLDEIGREGERFAREGELAAAMLGETREAGHLTREDLVSYEVARREPIRRKLPGWEIALNPAPSMGGTLIAAMLSARDPLRRPDALALAEAIDATDRRWREAPTDPGRLLGTAQPLVAGLATRGTTHVGVVDREGNVAAVTVSNGEGNGRIVPGCGFMLNNMLGEEDVNPGGFHRWATGARLSSMMAPTVAVSGAGDLVALGSGGSNRIRTAVLQVLIHRLEKGLDLEAAVTAPRMHVEKGHLDFEDFFGEEARTALMEAFRDHRAWPEPSLFYGGVHSVERRADGAFAGSGDPRREGVFKVV